MGSKDGLIRQLLAGDRLGDSEINYLGRRLSVTASRHQDVRRFDVSMDDSLLVRVLYCVANLNEEFQTSVNRERMSVAIIRDGLTFNQFHHEIRPPTSRCAGIEHVTNTLMIHQRQCLPLRFKPGDHVFRVHSRLDNFERNTSSDGCLLFSHVNHSASALTNLLQQLVMANAVARFFSRLKRLSCSCWPVCGWSAKEIA